MEINLTKEQLKECCELIDDEYGYCVDEYNGVLRYTTVPEKQRMLHADISMPVLMYPFYYRDFLQLVIEGINNKWRENDELGWCIDQNGWFVETSLDSKPHTTYYLKDMSTTEAKEQAIIYCLDNMEV